MSPKRLIFLALIITCLFWWYNIDNQILIVLGRSLSILWAFQYVKSANDPFAQWLRKLNTDYLCLVLSIVLVYKGLNIVWWYDFEFSTIIRLVARIASISINQQLLIQNKLYFGDRIVDKEGLIMIVSVLLGSRLIQHYRFQDPNTLYLFVTWAMRIGITVLHLLAYQDHKRLRSRPYFMVISVLFLSSCLRGFGSMILYKYSETSIAKAKIIEAKPQLPNRFPPQLGPKLMSGDITV